MTFLSDVLSCSHSESEEETLFRGGGGLIYCKNCGCHRKQKLWIKTPWILPCLVVRAEQRLSILRMDRRDGVLGKDGKPVRLVTGLTRMAWACTHPKRRVHEFWSGKDGLIRQKYCLRTCLECGCFSRTQNGIDRAWYPYFAYAEAQRRKAQRKSTAGGKKPMDMDVYFNFFVDD